MMDFETIKSLEDQHSVGVYSKRPVAIVRGKGAHLFDVNGREYIDCVGGQGAANLGHANPKIAAAIAAQAERLIGLPEMFYNDTRAELMDRLCNLTGMESIFFCNSGTEAVEAALKFSKVITGRKEIVATVRGFHGRSMGSLSATWEKRYREPFEPLVPGFSHIPYNDVDALDSAITDQTAAFIVEIVQGEGGIRPGSPEYFHAAEKICKERGALLIIDEVQSGFGRTGRWYAHQHYDLKPDLLTSAKSLGGGIPFGAVMLRKGFDKLPTAVHGSTFGGNPIACAASLAAIDFIEEEHLIEKTAENGAWFLNALREIESPLIREVRGLGLMIGMELKQKTAPYIAQLTERGILVLTAGMTVMRFLPPLVIERSDLEIVVKNVKEVLQA
ncbi:aspartate aminotransferase family protein [Flexilinea flocculi]|jgi:acetylornithine/LysW-gamma-L-lysine aminotransferase|uniref:Putative [LysW]-aminoadipate semialdehyde transaminase n=1 Tax=Flexilinea flocculi TaxID=1678840 RepID=A0A0S7BTW8_9CHLR|nr:acetylornithine/succinylornithine family transaminase [Flexilinea flocculi]NMB93561.1 acetylornithine/succinylornithine family transaminase [Flexilinea flocculi]GAP40390.1 acetylornithine aminotransferase apoenzyme [Flexilinea flocculi]